MRYSIVFAIYGAALAAGAFAAGQIGLLLAWAAASCLLIALAYGFQRPGLLGKRSDGSQSVAAIIVLLPYLGLQHVVWFLAHRLRGQVPLQEISPGIWLGRRLLPHEIPAAIRTVVDLTAEFHEPAGVRAGRRYVCAPTLDATAPPAEALARIANELVDAHEPVLIHCASGYGRSALVVACALLVRREAASAEEAVAKIVAARPGARLNRLQSDALSLFASGVRATA